MSNSNDIKLIKKLFDNMGWKDFNTKILHKPHATNSSCGWFVESDILAYDGFIGSTFEETIETIVDNSWRFRAMSHVAKELQFERPDTFELFKISNEIHDYPYLDFPEYDYSSNMINAPNTYHNLVMMGILFFSGMSIGMSIDLVKQTLLEIGTF